MPPSPDLRPDPVLAFTARCEARAILWAACEFDLHKAVDELQRDAARTGLVAKLGQDAVQGILRDAFHSVRMRPRARWKRPPRRMSACRGGRS
jgi:hypothetical protein